MKHLGMLEVKRTLVKSGPELWAEVADPAAMARHLSPFGSVRITRAEPERFVEWEGDVARGAIRLEPSGFGTRVVLTADTRPPGAPPAAAPEPAPSPEPEPEQPKPEAEAEAPIAPEPARQGRGVWTRLFRRRAAAAVLPAPAPAPAPEPAPAVDPPAPELVADVQPLISDELALDVLTETLDALGTAHHRPFSRA